ncbi:MAG: DUF4279 domain-containing protein [Actinomycetota bacterium]
MENREHGKNKASLRLHSGVTSTDEISVALKMKPDVFKVKGSRAVPENIESYVYPAHLWLLESDLDEMESLDQHISRLIDFVESRAAAFKELIKTCEVDIFCGYFPDGWTGHFALLPDLLKRLTIIPIKIMVELYEPITDEDFIN